ncbi:MAG: BamA/TamA family outer membrane protein [Myxococcota bacterium]
MRVAATLGLGGLLLGAVGCASKRPGIMVKKIRFEGNTGVLSVDDGIEYLGVTDYDLRSAMEQSQNERFAWLAPNRRRAYLDEDTLRLDAWRIENWYAHHGYFNARFMGWDVAIVRDRSTLFGSPPKAVITGRVIEGEPTILRLPEDMPGDAVALTGLEGLGVGGRPLRSQISDVATSYGLSEGSGFNLDSVQSVEGVIKGILLNKSYARATVSSEVEVWPDASSAQVRINMDIGPACRFGEITIYGDFDISEEIIRTELLGDDADSRLQSGDAYSANALAAAQQRLFGLGVFSVVNVVPLLDESALDVIDVRVTVTERKPQQIRIGGGVLLESGKQDVHASVSHRHVNIANRLIRLDTSASLGYTIIGDVAFDEDGSGDDSAIAVTDQGITYNLSSTLTIPRPTIRGRLVRPLELNLSGEIEQIIEPAYEYFATSLSPGATINPKDSNYTFQLGYDWTRFTYGEFAEEDLSDDSDVPIPISGQTFVLSELEESVIFDSRNDPIDTRRGSYAILELTQAGGILGGQSNFIRIRPEYRAFYPLLRLSNLRFAGETLRRRLNWTPPGRVAFRAGGGAIFTYGQPEQQIIPLQERLYLGGSNDVRGWSRNALGPYVCGGDAAGNGRRRFNGTGGQLLNVIGGSQSFGYGCSSPSGYATSVDELRPVGGRYSVYGTVEYRRYLQEPLSTLGIALFSDFGMVFLDSNELGEEWQRFTEAVQTWTFDDGDRLLAQNVGGGLRYQTPIGPVRIDLAYRLDRDIRFDNEPRFRFHFALGETF